MNRLLDVTSSVLATMLRAATGFRVGALGPRPDKPLELYEFEACPYCRKAREALSHLDLPALLNPGPKGGPRFRERVKDLGGKARFPFLVDPNTETSMYESDEIVRYLAKQYGAGKVPRALALGPLTNASASLASIARLGKGMRYRPARAPDKPLELWSFEASPFCRIAREALCELELPYLLHNVGKGSARRDAFVARSGKMMVPYLADPNTGREMFESADIVRYLDETYALPKAGL
jgi:glutathione S-transferase